MTTEDFKTWAPIVSAIAGSTAALIALINVLVTNWNTQRTRALDLHYKMEQQWDSERMWKLRVKASKSLLTNDTESSAIDAVLDFFDALGRMVEDGDINKKNVWESFYYWAIGYLDATVEARAEARKEDRTVWEHAVALRTIMVEQQKLHLGTVKPTTRADIEKFLRIESELDDD